jgi:hypothetical protein
MLGTPTCLFPPPWSVEQHVHRIAHQGQSLARLHAEGRSSAQGDHPLNASFADYCSLEISGLSSSTSFHCRGWARRQVMTSSIISSKKDGLVVAWLKSRTLSGEFIAELEPFSFPLCNVLKLMSLAAICSQPWRIQVVFV